MKSQVIFAQDSLPLPYDDTNVNLQVRGNKGKERAKTTLINGIYGIMGKMGFDGGGLER